MYGVYLDYPAWKDFWSWNDEWIIHHLLFHWNIYAFSRFIWHSLVFTHSGFTLLVAWSKIYVKLEAGVFATLPPFKHPKSLWQNKNFFAFQIGHIKIGLTLTQNTNKIEEWELTSFGFCLHKMQIVTSLPLFIEFCSLLDKNEEKGGKNMRVHFSNIPYR